MPLSINIYVLILFGILSVSCVSTVPKGNRCDRFILSPPKTDDPADSIAIANKWRNQSLQRSSGCESIVRSAQAARVFQRLGFEYHESLEKSDLTKSIANNLYKNTKATKIVILKPAKKNGKQRYYSTEVYGLRDIKAVRTASISSASFAAIESEPDRKFQERAVKRVINFLPNSFTISGTDSSLSTDHFNEKNYEMLERKGNPRLPELISGLGMTHVIHPDRYHEFDVDSRGYLSLNLDSITQNFKTKLADSDKPSVLMESTKEHRIQYIQMSPLATYELSLVYNLGTSFASLGLGIGPYWLKDSTEGSSYGFQAYNQLQLGHRFFATKKIFLQLTQSNSWTLEEASSARDATLIRSLETKFFKVTVGYFFPGAKRYLHRRVRGSAL